MSRLILPVAGTTGGPQRGVAPPRHSCCYDSSARLALQPASGTINRQFRRDTTPALARGLGVDPALVIDVVSGGPLDCGYFQIKGAAMLAGNYAPSFSVDNAVKDSRLIVEAARQAAVAADVAAAGLQRFERAQARGHGAKDMAASHLA